MKIVNNKKPIFTAVILAAGMGTRLGGLTKDRPKALTLINGRPIIQYSIAWAKLLGAAKIVVVGGYLFEQLADTVHSIDDKVILVENKKYDTTQRMLSLLTAREEIVGGLLVFDGDYIYHQSVAEKMKPHFNNVTIFATDDQSEEVQLDMMIKVDKDNHLINMAKGLSDYQYYFNSVMFCSQEHLADYFASAHRTIQEIGANKSHVEEALLEYVSQGGVVKVVDIGKPDWVEIDNPEELAIAQRLVGRDPRGYCQ